MRISKKWTPYIHLSTNSPAKWVFNYSFWDFSRNRVIWVNNFLYCDPRAGKHAVNQDRNVEGTIRKPDAGFLRKKIYQWSKDIYLLRDLWYLEFNLWLISIGINSNQITNVWQGNLGEKKSTKGLVYQQKNFQQTYISSKNPTSLTISELTVQQILWFPTFHDYNNLQLQDES